MPRLRLTAILVGALGLVLAWGLAGPGLRRAGASPAIDTGVSVSVDANRLGVPINQNLTGVNDPVHGSGAAMQAIGVPSVRTDVNFQANFLGKPVYDCATGQWNPAELDGQVALDREEGGQPLLVVDYSPACLATPPSATAILSHSPPDTGALATKWSALVYQMAYHEITVEGVRSFEVWNQPDDPNYWTGTQADYLALYADTSRSLEAAAAEAGTHIQVGGPALADPAGHVDLSWVQALAARASSANLPLNFVSWHLFANLPFAGPSPSGTGPFCFGLAPGPDGSPCWYNPGLNAAVYGQSVGEVRSLLAHYPKLHPQLWIDEWNLDPGYDPRQSSDYGAAFAVAALDSVQSVGLDRMNFYKEADSAASQLDNSGLLTAGNQTKPVYDAMAFWHDLAGRQAAVAVTPDPGGTGLGGRVGAVAALDADGTLRVLVYNFVSYDPTGDYGRTDPNHLGQVVTLSLAGLKHRPYSYSRAQIDATHRGDVIGGGTLKAKGAPLRFSLGSEMVDLITLSPRVGTSPFPIFWVVVGVAGLIAAGILGALVVVGRHRPT
ncbi:MAG: GH39 family glycosyl hydrolase [Acidimicrobiales bacterium]